MRNTTKKVAVQKRKRAQRVRRKLRGSQECPRLSVFKSIKHMSCQLIDDYRGITIASFGTQSKQGIKQKKSKEAARFIGEKIAELAREKNISKVVFDRGPFKYHGLVAELADGARKGGLQF